MPLRKNYAIIKAIKMKTKKQIKSKIKVNPETKFALKTKIFCLLASGFFLWPLCLFSSDLTPGRIIYLTNGKRIGAGALVVTANQLLEKAALEKADAIFAAQTFQHSLDGKKFSHWVSAAGYKYEIIGENLAINFQTAAGTIKAWENSLTHKQNLFNPDFTEIGVAVKEGNFQGYPTTLVVQIFGRPAPAQTPPPKFPAVTGHQQNQLRPFDAGAEITTPLRLAENDLAVDWGNAKGLIHKTYIPLLSVQLFLLLLVLMWLGKNARHWRGTINHGQSKLIK